MIDVTSAAMAAHQKAWAAIQELGDDVDDETLDRASRLESDAIVALARAPCRDDEDFHLKLRYLVPFLLKREKAPSVDDGFGALAIVVGAYLGLRG